MTVHKLKRSKKNTQIKVITKKECFRKSLEISTNTCTRFELALPVYD